MYGLMIIKYYLNEFLDDSKTYDAHAYTTNKRGTIALADTKKSAIIGLVDIVGTHKISAEDYCKWHATGKWEGLVFQVEDKDYYAYDFENPRRLATLIKVVEGCGLRMMMGLR